jgi:hypothetical protein
VPENTSPTSFFLDSGAVVYMSSYNALFPEINRYDPADGTVTQISKPERTMGEEGLMQTTFATGEGGGQHIHHIFNDTVYLYRNRRLVPDYLFKLAPYAFSFSDMMMQNLMNPSSEPRVQIEIVTETGKYTFVRYRAIRFRDDMTRGLAFWSSDLMIVPRSAFHLTESDLPFEVRENDNDIFVRYILK